MIELRPHHLLCLLTYSGQGYSDAFVANFSAIVKRLGAGEPVRIVRGPDDICRPVADDPEHHCHEARIKWRDERALAALCDVLDRHLDWGVELVLDRHFVERSQRAFKLGESREACRDCQWYALCSDIAGGDFVVTELRNVEILSRDS